MTDETKPLAIINDGKLARLMLQSLSPMIEDIKKEAEARFLGQFRSGKLDSGNSLAYAAVLGTIEDIVNRLQQKISASDRQLERGSSGRDDSDRRYDIE
jgi:hypothetical protein